MNTILKMVVPAAVLVVVAIQFVQPERTNPPHDPDASFEVVAAVAPQIQGVVGRSCRDCHSNKTTWPWYSKVSPVSWLVAEDVKAGRVRLNLSQWNWYSNDMSRLRMKDMCIEAKAGRMPPWQYTLVHTEAKLSAADVSALCSTDSASR